MEVYYSASKTHCSTVKPCLTALCVGIIWFVGGRKSTQTQKHTAATLRKTHTNTNTQTYTNNCTHTHTHTEIVQQYNKSLASHKMHYMVCTSETFWEYKYIFLCSFLPVFTITSLNKAFVMVCNIKFGFCYIPKCTNVHMKKIRQGYSCLTSRKRGHELSVVRMVLLLFKTLDC